MLEKGATHTIPYHYRTTTIDIIYLNCRNRWTTLISCDCDIGCSSSAPQILAWRPTPTGNASQPQRSTLCNTVQLL